MIEKPKIYLETSVISAVFDERNPERKILTQNFFKSKEEFELFISEITIAEIEKTPDKKLKKKMKDFIEEIALIPLLEEVEWLASEYIRYNAVPKEYFEDAYHIAVAVINRMDYLLSWNFKHIVRVKTRDIIRMVNTINKLKQIEIITPAELL